MKNWIRVIGFLLIFCVLFGFTQTLFQAKWGPGTAGAFETTNYLGFYDEPDHSLDVLLMGASNVFYGTSPVKMYEKYGIAGYVRGSANQPMLLTYYTLLDTLRSQSPKVVVVELSEMLEDFDPIGMEYSARRALDYMEFSKIKLDAIRALPIDGSEQTRISYLFPLLRYHSRWQELNNADLEYFGWERHNYTKGQYIGRLRFDFKWPEDFMTPSDEIAPILEQNVDILTRIAELCQEKGISLVLLTTPVGDWTYARHNALQQIADTLEVPYLDYNLPELVAATGFVDTEDFHYNKWHLRVTGADKISVHLGAYLMEHYDLPDRRNDPAYALWEDDVARYNLEKEKAGLPK